MQQIAPLCAVAESLPADNKVMIFVDNWIFRATGNDRF